MISDRTRFYMLLCLEALFYPFIYIVHWIRILFFSDESKTQRMRKKIENDVIYVCVHEWGNYKMNRQKTIKNGKSFSCGLQGQIDRFAHLPNVELTVTMSESEKHTDIEYVKSMASHYIEVSNSGMDFSGYSAFYDRIKNLPNSYVILSNSSVNIIDEDFLPEYINYMDRNTDVGILGISYCTKIVQTLIRHNFTPHLQSFFLLTTTDVLREIIEQNFNKFPGVGIQHKLLLIRHGEIRMTTLTRKLGYRIAVVNPQNGMPYKFECYQKWKLPKGDIRQKISTPNRITPIVQT